MKFPKKIAVARLISARYIGERPLNWDERFGGVDVIETTEGEKLTLASSGQQSSPQPGWTLMITGEKSGVGLTWTLYGIPKAA